MKSKVFVCNHQIFLNENQRYDLYACIPVKAYGIFIQAEITKNMNAKNIQEIFCTYDVDCKLSKKPMEIKNNSIKIHIQQLENFQDLIDGLDTSTKNKLSLYEEEQLDLKDLLNYDEGGKQCLFFETMSINSKKNIKNYHKIEIKDISEYSKSVEFISFNNLKESC